MKSTLPHLFAIAILTLCCSHLRAQTQPPDSLSGTITVRKPIEATGDILIKPYGKRYNGEAGAALNYGNGLIYPAEAVQKGKQGKVIASFIMNANGTVSDVTLDLAAHELLNEAVLSHIRKMPDKLKRGVKVKYTITVVFRLE